MKQKTYQKKGFTLIEVLLVIGIIGILSSLVLTSVGSIKADASETRYIAYLRSVGAAVEVALALGSFDDYRNLPSSSPEHWQVTESDGTLSSYSAGTATCWLGEAVQTEFANRLANAATIDVCQTSPYSADYGVLLSPRGSASGIIDGIWVIMHIDNVSNVGLCDKLAWETTFISNDSSYCGVYIEAL